MEIGTGIVIGCSILGAVAVLFRIFNSKKKNNPGGYLLAEVFKQYKEGTNAQLETLTKSVSEIKDGLKRVHTRIDGLLNK